eukprot:NODE_3094_length_706_cov_379.701674_g2187_i0.p3 GENE.NODE_3094_length_706_cov_379.701674_g2187_i0~~NODE_3094_length_706_cov_379.701674_g2187_i0.p3  ORF type:complete len:83 (-),score=33.86 NODE_3094_length_706_cov_379.701674_g2187_i0:456-680(-)
MGTPEGGDWWFRVSDDYRPQAECMGKPCAVCSACSFRTVRVGGDTEFLCEVHKSFGIVEIQRRNVYRAPSKECP